ncbi:MAG: dTDP-4-dehydrorhamnose 3,5-epimerase [Desulfuromonadaceae bacterium]|nr:dTDP-4-dehydrorhamnose 3,5-epimerase [Desulfuromonadaceae bacterium]
MLVNETGIAGCFEIIPRLFRDDRGSFVKTFHSGSFGEQGLVTSFAEEFYSWSKRGVLRGLHFQTPPSDHTKVVTCLSGEVLDAVVDLRTGSPTFGEHRLFNLRAAKATILYIPSGLAHGFMALSEEALMYYQVTTVHDPAADHGIRWDSAGIPWPLDNPLVSPRDAAFPTLKDFVSPFYFREEQK